MNAAYVAARNEARNEARNAAWNPAYDATMLAAYDATMEAARDATWNAAWDATWNAAWNATWNATAALIAYDDASKYLEMSSDHLRFWSILIEDPAAVLLIPAVIAFERINELELA
jgi:hypothetical protein